MKNIIESVDLNKTYTMDKIDYPILKGINLKIKQGEFVSLMGPSGSGKSTLLYSLSGMDSVTSGYVYFNGIKLNSLNESKLAEIRLKNMGFVFQHIHLLKNLSLFDNIVLPAYLLNKQSRKYTNARAMQFLKEMEVDDLVNHDITQVSGGQLQRAAICRSLINDPDVVFGDEPTGALNSKYASEIMDILKKINGAGKTVLIATHDVKVAAKTDRVLYMLDGKIIDEYNNKDNAQANCESVRSKENLLSNWLIEKAF